MALGDQPGRVLDQALGLAVADDACGVLHSFGESGRAVLLVMGVAGEDGHQALLQQGVGYVLGGAAEVAGYGSGSDLQQAALFDEGLELVRRAHDALVAFGVGDHRHDIALQQPGSESFRTEGDFAVRELQQQHLPVLPAAEEGDGAFGEAGHQLHAEAYLGGPADLQLDAGLGQACGEGVVSLVDALAVVVVAAGVDVRSADDVGDAVLYRDARQSQGGFQVGGAVVDAGEQVVVQVDHRCVLVSRYGRRAAGDAFPRGSVGMIGIAAGPRSGQ